MSNNKYIPLHIRDKAHKLLALASSGIDGEKVNAQALLDQFLQKHGLTMSDITGEAATATPRASATYIHIECPETTATDFYTDLIRQGLFIEIVVHYAAKFGYEVYTNGDGKALPYVVKVNCPLNHAEEFKAGLREHMNNCLQETFNTIDGYIYRHRLNSQPTATPQAA